MRKLFVFIFFHSQLLCLAQDKFSLGFSNEVFLPEHWQIVDEYEQIEPVISAMNDGIITVFYDLRKQKIHYQLFDNELKIKNEGSFEYDVNKKESLVNIAISDSLINVLTVNKGMKPKSIVYEFNIYTKVKNKFTLDYWADEIFYFHGNIYIGNFYPYHFLQQKENFFIKSYDTQGNMNGEWNFTPYCEIAYQLERPFYILSWSNYLFTFSLTRNKLLKMADDDRVEELSYTSMKLNNFPDSIIEKYKGASYGNNIPLNAFAKDHEKVSAMNMGFKKIGQEIYNLVIDLNDGAYYLSKFNMKKLACLGYSKPRNCNPNENIEKSNFCPSSFGLFWSHGIQSNGNYYFIEHGAPISRMGLTYEQFRNQTNAYLKKNSPVFKLVKVSMK